MLLLAPSGHYHRSWESAWQLAGWGLSVVLVAVVVFLVEAWP